MVNVDFLEAIVSLIAHCGVCKLSHNGRALPFIGVDAKAILLGEAPGKEEVKERTPFVGKSGKYMFTVTEKYGFTRNDFVIVNTVQCRPVVKKGDRILNGKPSEAVTHMCTTFVEAILFGSGLSKVMCVGAYAKDWVARYTKDLKLKSTPISKLVGQTVSLNNINSLNKACTQCVEVTFNYHPAATIYDSSKKEKFEAVFGQFLKSL